MVLGGGIANFLPRTWYAVVFRRDISRSSKESLPNESGRTALSLPVCELMIPKFRIYTKISRFTANGRRNLETLVMGQLLVEHWSILAEAYQGVREKDDPSTDCDHPRTSHLHAISTYVPYTRTRFKFSFHIGSYSLSQESKFGTFQQLALFVARGMKPSLIFYNKDLFLIWEKNCFVEKDGVNTTTFSRWLSSPGYVAEIWVFLFIYCWCALEAFLARDWHFQTAHLIFEDCCFNSSISSHTCFSNSLLFGIFFLLFASFCSSVSISTHLKSSSRFFPFATT